MNGATARSSLVSFNTLWQRRVLRSAAPWRGLATTTEESTEAGDRNANGEKEGERSTSDPKSRSKVALLHDLLGKSDGEIVDMVRTGTVSQYRLERALAQSVQTDGASPDCGRAVRIRRLWLEDELEEESSRQGEGKTGDGSDSAGKSGKEETSRQQLSKREASMKYQEAVGASPAGDTDDAVPRFPGGRLPYAVFDYETFYQV